MLFIYIVSADIYKKSTRILFNYFKTRCSSILSINLRFVNLDFVLYSAEIVIFCNKSKDNIFFSFLFHINIFENNLRRRNIIYKSINTLKDLQNYLSGASIVAFDFETAPDKKYRNEDKAALDAHKSHIVGISFSVAEGSGVYLPIAHKVGQNADGLTEIWAWLKDFFTSASVTKIAHNLAFESQFLYARGIVVQEPCYDTIAAAQLVYKNEKEFRSLGDCGLKTLVPEYFQEQLPTYGVC